jgi:hypothetical protein
MIESRFYHAGIIIKKEKGGGVFRFDFFQEHSA